MSIPANSQINCLCLCTGSLYCTQHTYTSQYSVVHLVHMQTKLQQSRLAAFFFENTSLAPLWLLVRLYVGYLWLMAGWDKITSDVWVGSQAGVAVKGFLTGALTKTGGAHPDVSSWYAYFIEHFALNHTVALSYMVAYGEVAVGIALIIGLFVGVSAFFGMFMNINYLFAGTVSINATLIVLEFLLILAWKIAGHLGIDRVVLPKIFKRRP